MAAQPIAVQPTGTQGDVVVRSTTQRGRRTAQPGRPLGQRSQADKRQGNARRGEPRRGDPRRGDRWQSYAACKGPLAPIFFPPSHAERREERDEREAQAKAICAVCPVTKDCLEYAIAIREPHGIWGGLTEIERRAELDRRAAV
ncbi:MAG: WhiB family transcriptional regulator [Acidimicrobiales bacterium]